jgi:hypothetical protein
MEQLIISHLSPNKRARLLSSLAATPFVVDNDSYTSVLGFQLAMYFHRNAEPVLGGDRDRGREEFYWLECSRAFGSQALQLQRIVLRMAAEEGRERRYFGERVSLPHLWQLAERALRAKVGQHEDVRNMLIATAGYELLDADEDPRSPRPTVHTLLLHRIREELLANGIGPAGRIATVKPPTREDADKGTQRIWGIKHLFDNRVSPKAV